MTNPSECSLNRAAAILFTAASMMVTTAGADPTLFYPKPFLSRAAVQDLAVDGCDGSSCSFMFAQALGDYASLYVTEYGNGSYKSFNCPMGSGDLVVRADGAEASLNVTVDAAECYVTEQCDEQGVCAPDYEGTINVVASLRRPAGSNIASTQNKIKSPDGSLSAFTCQEKSGSDFLDTAAAINGHSLDVSTSIAARRECASVAKSR